MTSIPEQKSDEAEPRRSRRARDVFEWQRAMRAVPKGDLSPLARHTLLTLATFADGNGSRCFPTLEGLADAMGRSRSVTAEGVKELVEGGWVKRRSITVAGVKRTLSVPMIPEDGGESGSEHRPAHRTANVRPTGRNQPTDQPNNDGDRAGSDEQNAREVDPLDDEAGQVALTVLGRLGVGAQRWSEDHPEKHDQLVGLLVAMLRDGRDGSRLVSELSGRSAPKAGVDTPVGLLLSRARLLAEPTRPTARRRAG